MASPTLANSTAPKFQQDRFKCAGCQWTGMFCFGRCPNCGSFKLYNITPESDRPYDGNLIDKLIDTVIEAEKPKPPQSATEPDETRDKIRDRNAAMLHALWILGEQMGEQAFELPRPKPDPLTIALNGFPDVNTSRAYYAGD
jgi:hypothetical protein